MYRNPSNWPGEEGVVGSAQTRVVTPLQAIGEIQSAIGSVTVRRDGGIVARVNVGDLVYQGDAIATGADGAVGIIFTDGTVFNLSNDGRAVLNEFAYDPNATSNSALLSLAQGTFAFIAGKVAKTGSLRIDTPVARIRGGDGGIGILTLAALTFSAIHETEAASRQEALLDDGIIARYGTFEITTRDGRVVLADDPGETIVIDPTGTVARIPNTSSRMAELQQAQQNAMATLSLGQQGGGPPGSSGNPFGDQAPQIFQLAPQPINNTVGPGGFGNDNPNLFKEGFIFVPPPQAAPPPPAPIISLTAIAITNPSTAISIVNASAAHAGFPIIGTTSGIEEGRTVTITIVNSSNQVVYAGTTTVTNGNWSVEISSAAAKFIPDGSYTVTADTSDAAGNPAPQATKSVLVDTIAAAPSVPLLTAASDSGTSSADKITNVIAPTVTGGGAEAGATVTLYDSDGTVLGTAVADASGNWTITSSPLSDGGHKLTATQFDLAGNASAISAALPIIVDTAAAAPSAPDMVAASDSFGPTGTDTDNITNNATPTFTGNDAEAGATVTLYDSDGTTVLGTAVADILGKWTITSSPLSDGVHILTATQTDIAGNTGAISAALFVKVDTVVAAPSAPDLIAASDSFGPTGTDTDNITNAATPTFTGSGAEAFATVTLFDSDGTTVRGTTTADVNGNWAITSSLLSDGDHALTVKQTDMAGNLSEASSVLGVRIDTAAPNAPVISQVTDDVGSIQGTVSTNGFTDDITPTLRVSLTGTGAVAGDSVQLYNGASALGSAVILTSQDIINGYASITTSALPQGTYNFNAKITDIAGNPGPASSDYTVTVDTTAPSAPTITSVNDDVSPVTGNLTSGDRTNDPDLTVKVSLTGTGAVAGNTVQLYDGTGTLSPLGSTYTLTTADISNGFANVQTGPLTDGTTYTITARITDAAGNQSLVSTNSFTVTEDSTAPSAPSITSVTDDVTPVIGTLSSGDRTNDPNLTVKVSLTGTGAVVGNTIQLYDGTGTLSPLGSTYTLTAADIAADFANVQTGPLTNGTTYTITARITDAAGNQSLVSTNSFTVTEDITAPSAPSITSVTDDVTPVIGTLSSGDRTNDPNLTVKVSLTGTGAVVGNTIQLYDGTGTLSPLGSTYTLTAADIAADFANVQTGPLTNGTTYTITARITDAAGNQSLVSTNSFTVTEDITAPSAPSITSVTDDVTPVIGTLSSGDRTNDPNLTVKVSLTGTGAVVGNTIQLYDGTGTLSPLGSTYTLTAADIAADFANVQTGPLTNGTTYTITARITDAAGNQSLVSTNSFTVTEDITAPSAPSITSVTDDVTPVIGTLSSGDRTNDPNLTVKVSLTGTGAVVGNTIQLYDGTGTLSPLGSTYTLTAADIAADFANVQTGPLTNGTTYTITARITDAAGNQSLVSTNSFTVTEDSTAPSAPSITSVTDDVTPVIGTLSSGDRTNDPNLTVKVSLTGTGAVVGNTIQLYDGTGTLSPLGSTYTLTAADIAADFANVQTGPLTNGTTYTITARITDAAGNQSLVSTNSFTVTEDITAPSAPSITSVTDNFGSVQGTVSNNGSTDDSTPTLTITAEAGSTVTIYQNGKLVGTATETATSGTFTFTPTTALTPGTYSFTATATDAAGNTSTLSTSYTITEASTLTIAANEVLVLKGETLTFDTIQNDGTILVQSNNTSTILGDITGTGNIVIKNNATLELKGSIGSDLTILFSVDPGGGANAKLILDEPSEFHAKISDFTAPNDQIDLKNFIVIVQSTIYVDNGVPGDDTGGLLKLFGYLNGSSTATEIDIIFVDGDYTTASFKFTSDGQGGTLLNDPPTSTTTTEASTTITEATVIPVAETSATAVAVDDDTIVPLDIAVDPDGGEMSSATISALPSDITLTDSAGSLTLHGALTLDAGAFQLAIVPRKRDDADGRHGDRANWNLQAASISLGAAVLFLVEHASTIAEAATYDGLFAVENDIADTLSGSGPVTLNSDAALKFGTISHSISGALEVTDGRLEIANTASETGLLKIDAEATLQFAGDDTVNVNFAGSTGAGIFSDDAHGGEVVVHAPTSAVAAQSSNAAAATVTDSGSSTLGGAASHFVTDHLHFGDANTDNHDVEPQSVELPSQAGLHAPAEIPLATFNNGPINLSLPIWALNMEPGSVASQAPELVTEHLHFEDANTGNHDGIGDSHAGNKAHSDHSSPALASAANDTASQAAQDPGPLGTAPAGDHGKDSNPGHDGHGESHPGNTAHSDHSPPGLASAANDVASQAAQDPGPPGAAAPGDHGKDSNPGHDGIGESHAGNNAHSDHSPPGLASAANDIASQAAQNPGPFGAAPAGDHGKDSNPGHDGIGESHAGNTAHSDHSPAGVASAANNVAPQAAQDPGPPSAAAAGDHGKDSNPGHDGIGDSHAGNKTHADQASPALAAAGNDIAPEAAAQNPGAFGAAAVGDHGKDSNSGHDGIGESHAGDNTHSDQASLALPSGANNVAPQAAQDPGAFGAAPVGDHGKDSNSGHDGIGESHAGDNTHSDQASLALPSGANNVAPQAAQDPGPLGAAPVGDHGKDSNSGHDGIGESHAGDKTLSDQPSPALAAAANDPAPQAAQDPGSLGAAPVGDHAKDLFVFDANFGHDGIGQSHAGNVTQFDQASPALSTAANNVAPQAAQDPGPLGAAAAGDHAKDLFVFDANFGDDGIGQSHAGNMTQFDQPSSALPTAANNVAPQAAQDPGPLGAAAVGDHAKDLFAFDANFGHDGIGQSQAGNMTQFDQPIFETVSDILTTAEAHSAQAGLDPVAALGQNHDAAVTSVQKDKPLSDFIVHA